MSDKKIAFRPYQGKPIVRLAYQIKPDDTITDECESSTHHLTNAHGDRISFEAHQEVKAGDYIVYLNDSDVYHCSEKVFLERNIVE